MTDALKTLAERIKAIGPATWMNGCNEAFMNGFHYGIDAAAALAEQAAPAGVMVKPLPGIDTQVLTAAMELDFFGKTNPAWAFIDQDANQMSFGRWAKCGRNPAPYIRADIVLAALEPDPTPALGWKAMQTAARAASMRAEIARRRLRAAYDRNDAEGYDNWSAIVSHLDIALDAILALPGPTDADLDCEALNRPVVREVIEALTKLYRSVCGPTGFAEAVRHNSGKAYPWHSLDEADALATAALAKIGGDA